MTPERGGELKNLTLGQVTRRMEDAGREDMVVFLGGVITRWGSHRKVSPEALCLLNGWDPKSGESKKRAQVFNSLVKGWGNPPSHCSGKLDGEMKDGNPIIKRPDRSRTSKGARIKRN